MGKKMKEEHRTGRERDIYNKIADLNKNDKAGKKSENFRRKSTISTKRRQ